VIGNVRKGRLVGYTSVRRKPSRTRVEECMRLYPTLFAPGEREAMAP
jgi:aerotaxis receptor